MATETIDINSFAENIKEQGVKILPVKFKSKAPDVLDFENYLTGAKTYDEEILPTQNYGAICGVISNNLGILDIEKIHPDDYHSKAKEPRHIPVEEEFLDRIIPNCKDVTLTTRTGSDGFHALVFFETIPDKTTKLEYVKDKDNIYRIDFKVTGQCVEAGSTHPNGKKYEMISNVRTIKKMDLHDILKRLERIGFKGTAKILNGELKDFNNFDTDDLLKGGWVRGERRRKMKSLYCKLRRVKKTDAECRAIIAPIIASLTEPLDEGEINHNFDDAESFFEKEVLPKNGYLEDKNEEFLKIWATAPTSEKIDATAYELVKLLIRNDMMVVKSNIRKKLSEWCNLHKVIPLQDKNLANAVSKIVNGVFADSEMVDEIMKLCYDLGTLQKKTIFDKEQTGEVGEWLKGRHHIKRIELSGQVIFFNGKYYEQDATDLIKRHARKSFVTSTNNSINEVVGYVEQTAPVIENQEIEKFMHLKCLENGIYDIKTGAFSTEFNPDYIILNYIPHKYNEVIEYPEIQKHVTEIISDDHDRQTFYDAISNSTHPYTGIDFQLGLVSIPGTGKTQLSKLIKMVLGGKNVSFATIHDISNDKTVQRDIAYLFINIDDDLSDADLKQPDALKKWVTQDDFSGRSIYAHTSTYRPTTRLMFMGNGLYEVTNPDDAEAIYERTHLIKLVNKFRNTAKQQVNIFERIENLDQELDGFITYLLKNATWLYENKQIHFKQNTDATRSMWNEYGNNLKKFIDDWISTGSTYKCANADVLNKWMGYCLDKKIKSGGKNKFYEKFNEMMGNSPTKIWVSKDESYYGYYGFSIREYPLNALDLPLKEKILMRIKEIQEDDTIFAKIDELLSN